MKQTFKSDKTNGLLGRFNYFIGTILLE